MFWQKRLPNVEYKQCEQSNYCLWAWSSQCRFFSWFTAFSDSSSGWLCWHWTGFFSSLFSCNSSFLQRVMQPARLARSTARRRLYSARRRQTLPTARFARSDRKPRAFVFVKILWHWFFAYAHHQLKARVFLKESLCFNRAVFVRFENDSRGSPNEDS